MAYIALCKVGRFANWMDPYIPGLFPPMETPMAEAINWTQ